MTSCQKKSLWICIVFGIVAAAAVAFILASGNVYHAEDFGFEDLRSAADADGDGVDDYTDIKDGALAYIATGPIYESRYYDGGYPDDGHGVCTDVIWSALQAAGYDLKAMVDSDIAAHPEAYPEIDAPDPNIDFRRVRNLKIFFERHAESLTLKLVDPREWQAGDIVVFAPSHIGICSNKRDIFGIPYLIHHGNPEEGAREAKDMRRMKIVGHYRLPAEGLCLNNNDQM